MSLSDICIKLQVRKGKAKFTSLSSPDYLLQMLARIILPSAISKQLGQFKQWLSLEEKLCNNTPKAANRLTQA